MPSQSGSARPPEPLRGYNVRIQVDGYDGYFTRCSGLGVRVNPIAYREGGAGGGVRQLAGQVEYPEFTLWYGVIPTLHSPLWSWLDSAMKGAPERRSVSLYFLDHEAKAQMTYNIVAAWPVTLSVAAINAMDNFVACESITLVHEGMSKGA